MSNFLELLIQVAAVFLAIFIEAVPFLLLGTLASGLVEVFFSQEEMARLLPKQPFLAAVAGSLMGLFVPICECGVVPLTRRLIKKGVSPALGISFLLAAPVINPIVIASTFVAFGFGAVFWGRIGLTLVISVIVGLIFSRQPDVNQILREPVHLTRIQAGDHEPTAVEKGIQPLQQPLQRVALITADEFLEMSRYLVVGALLAALLQLLVPQPVLAALGRGPVLSVIVMAAIAVLRSVGSTVDAFVALAFVGQFSSGALLSFLVYGPMVDIKSALMFARVFHRRSVVYLVLLPLLLTLISTAAWNLIGN